MHFYQHPVQASLEHLNTSEHGLTKQEARRRRKKYGPNAIKVVGVPLWKKIIEPFLDVFTLVLAAAAGISFWQNESLDGVIILVIIAISALIFYVQRFSTERVLKNLNKQTIEKVSVSRGGQVIKVNSTDLVPGDIVHLSKGEKIPADMRLLEATNLHSDESVLTGESLPIQKTIGSLEGKRQIYEQTNMLFSGAFVVSGRGKGVVVSTGNQTQFGNIATLSKQDDAKSPVQKKIDKLVSKIVMIVGGVAIVTFGLALLRGMELAESLRFVIALSVSAIPEGLPVAISVILVLGMRRMAAKKALVNNMRAIETLGVTNAIATDKTGTLTENKLSVQETWQPDKDSRLNESIAKSINQKSDLTDPLDKALMAYSVKNKTLKDHQVPAEEIPFEQKYAMSASVWHSGEDYEIFIKGAPEAILEHSKLSASALKTATKSLEELTAKGYRVIALATSQTKSSPKDFDALTKTKFQFQGFVAIADTLRKEAASAIKTALAAGVSVRMITGDHAETAYQIGKNLKMVEERSEVFDCRELDDLSDAKVLPIINKTKIFARVIPEQKYRLLTLLKKQNITAMTGDGVNDVPALSNAHIGIAMGSGSHIAKDAGDMILLDNNFKTIIDAIREGRVIIANIKRILFYLLATNAGEVLVMIGALLIGTQLPLEAVMILWVNLVTDTSMVIPLGLEPAEKDVMKQKPLKPRAPILNNIMIARIIITAITVAIVTLATYVFFSKTHSHEYAQTLAFTALVVIQWGHAFSARSTYDSIFTRLKVMNRSFYVGFLISVALQALVLFGPLGSLLHITPVDMLHLAVVSIISFFAPIVVCELHKFYVRKNTINS